MNPHTIPDLFADFPHFLSQVANNSATVQGITADSRKVGPGFIFVAFTGDNSDGHQFIENAIKNGAMLIVGEKDLLDLAVPYIKVPNARKMLAHLAAAFYDHPGRKLVMIGVTGTDGKTTTTNLIHSILRTAGLKAGLISTVNAIIGNNVLDTGFHVTTPDSPEVQYYLSKMVEAGLTHAILETTSHGWAQYRVDACEFDIGIVTNITHEHLDYHKNYENYLAAKSRLFTSLNETKNKEVGNRRLAVLNLDDGSYKALNNLTKVQQISYGFAEEAEIKASNFEPTVNGISFTVSYKDQSTKFLVPLYGEYNVSNCLAALGATVIGLGIPMEVALVALRRFEGIPGRMERIDLGQDFLSFVDFAHTPNALKVTLETGRSLLERMDRINNRHGRLIVLFGSAGLRDKAKRRMMAETSAKYADITILTAEDPRTESLDGILEEMRLGAVANGAKIGENLFIVPDRPESHRVAINMAKKGDIIFACGKGHEQSMCFGETEYLWDDRIAMKAALSEFLGLKGPEMPKLPTSNPNKDQV